MPRLVSAIVHAIAPPHLAEPIIGDLRERPCTRDALHTLLSLAAYGVQRAIIENWTVALTAAVVTCALCDAAIPMWGPIGLGAPVYHVLRLVLIGLILGCIPRASAFSCALLLALIAASNLVIDARQAESVVRVLSQDAYYRTLLIDGTAMGCSLLALRLLGLIRALAR